MPSLARVAQLAVGVEDRRLLVRRGLRVGGAGGHRVLAAGLRRGALGGGGGLEQVGELGGGLAESGRLELTLPVGGLGSLDRGVELVGPVATSVLSQRSLDLPGLALEDPLEIHVREDVGAEQRLPLDDHLAELALLVLRQLLGLRLLDLLLAQGEVEVVLDRPQAVEDATDVGVLVE